MSKRVILLILDGTGVGYMPDCKTLRRQDLGMNTTRTILRHKCDLVTLKKLGLFAIAKNNFENQFASLGKLALKHFGADTFYGHQEIMGSKILKPNLSILKNNFSIISQKLKSEKINFRFKKYFLVNKNIIIADNIEADWGQIINVTASTSETKFEEIIKIAKIIRKVVKHPRVIALGGTNTDIVKIEKAIIELTDGRVGVHSANSGIYLKNYQALHIGYGVNIKKQLPYFLVHQKVPVSLIGKIQDLIKCPNVWKKPMVDTNKIMQIINSRMDKQKSGLIAATIQETDLAGHSQDTKKFCAILKIVDKNLKILIKNMTDDDLLIITADHGNDPKNGTNNHTREFSPLIVYSKKILPFPIGKRDSLGDVATSISDYLNFKENFGGKSFLNKNNTKNNKNESIK